MVAMVSEMKTAALNGAIAEIFSILLDEQQKQNQKTTPSFLKEAMLKAREENLKTATLPGREKDSREL